MKTIYERTLARVSEAMRDIQHCDHGIHKSVNFCYIQSLFLMKCLLCGCRISRKLKGNFKKDGL